VEVHILFYVFYKRLKIKYFFYSLMKSTDYMTRVFVKIGLGPANSLVLQPRMDGLDGDMGRNDSC
jgi:hypothetical protein